MKRMSQLHRALKALPLWSNASARWLFINPHYQLNTVVGRVLGMALAERNAWVAPVILATVDRSGTHIQGQGAYFDLYRRAIMIPHVATPELAQRATRCGRSSAGNCSDEHDRTGWVFHGDMQRFDGGVRGAMRHIIEDLMAPTSLQSRILSRGTGPDGTPNPTGIAGRMEPAASHLDYRRVSAATSEAMRRAALCFAPQLAAR
jgi:hypothetical protein